MNINDLPPEIAALARKRQQECNDLSMHKDNQALEFSFNWESSPEGYLFWDNVYDGNFAPFYARYGQPDVHPNDGLVEEKNEQTMYTINSKQTPNGKFYCFGTINGYDHSFEGKSIDIAQKEMCEYLIKAGYISQTKWTPFISHTKSSLASIEPADEWVPKVGERVLVSDFHDGVKSWEMIFLFHINKYYYACPVDQVLNGNSFSCTAWRLCKPLPTPRRVTRAEIAKALNIEGAFEIID